MLEGVAAEVEASSSATLFFPRVAAISMTVDHVFTLHEPRP